MNAEQERYEDAKTRSQALDHAVDEAEAAVRQRPEDRDAAAKLEMVLQIRDEARTALASAALALASSAGKP